MWDYKREGKRDSKKKETVEFTRIVLQTLTRFSFRIITQKLMTPEFPDQTGNKMVALNL